MKNAELEAKYGAKNLFRVTGEDSDGNRFEVICRKPTKQVLSAILEETSDAKILEIYIKNCAVGGDLDMLENADVYSFVSAKIADKITGVKGEVKKY